MFSKLIANAQVPYVAIASAIGVASSLFASLFIGGVIG
jgi:hypothetical protein